MNPRNQLVDASDPKKVILRNVRGTVRWFSFYDHYGFINRHDTGEDVFFHVSALIQKGRLRSVLEPDQEVEFDVAYGIKGPKAVAITLPEGRPFESNTYVHGGRFPRRNSILMELQDIAPGAVPSLYVDEQLSMAMGQSCALIDKNQPEDFSDRRSNDQPLDESDPNKVILRNVRGMVWWFSVFDHYGFIKRHDNGEDVFVHASALVQSGRVQYALEPNQEVEFDVAHGIKGLKAVAVSLPGGLPIESNSILRFGRRRMMGRRRSGGAGIAENNNNEKKSTGRANGSSGDAKRRRNRSRRRRNRNQGEITDDAEGGSQSQNQEKTGGDAMKRGGKTRKPRKNRARRRRRTGSSKTGSVSEGVDNDQQEEDDELTGIIAKEPTTATSSGDSSENLVSKSSNGGGEDLNNKSSEPATVISEEEEEDVSTATSEGIQSEPEKVAV